jgi:hypothetical protein
MSGEFAVTSGSEVEVSAMEAMDAIEVSLSVPEGDTLDNELQEIANIPGPPVTSSNSYSSWFVFRRSKSPSSKRGIENEDFQTEDEVQPDTVSDPISDGDGVLSVTEKTEIMEDDWLQEVMTLSATNAPHDMQSSDIVSWLDHKEENVENSSESARGHTSWFGFKRSKASSSQKISRLGILEDSPEESESHNNDFEKATDRLPQSVTFNSHAIRDTTIANEWMKPRGENVVPSPHIGSSWYFGGNPQTAERNSPETSILGRSRLSTESTVPTVATEPEEEADFGGEDFAEEFEKGVAQSFAYLEI